MTYKKEILNKMSDLITAGFGLVAALAWNSAIQEVFKQVFGEDQGNLYAMFFYAIIVTGIAVFATIWIGRLVKKEDDKNK